MEVGMEKAAALEVMHKRETDQAECLKANVPSGDDGQKYLDADTTERWYWHAGYHTALADCRRLLSE